MRLFFVLLSLLPIVLFGQIVNRVELNLSDSANFEGFELLDQKFKENKLIISGENHTFREDNLSFLFKLFKYGHKHHNVNTIVFEFGLGFEYLVNKYVYEKDSVVMAYIDSRLYSQQSQLISKLQVYYESLAEEDRFFIEAIDIDRNWNGTFKALTLMSKKDSVPESLVFLVESIEAVSDYYQGEYVDIAQNSSYGFNSSSVSTQNSVKDVIDNYKENKEEMKTFLSEDFEMFNGIMESLEKGWIWVQYSEDNMVQEGVYREQEMYKNMLDAISKRPNLKGVGQFGRCHIKMGESNLTQCYNVNIKSFTKRLENSDKLNLRDSVFVMPIIYKQLGSGVNDASYINYFDAPNSADKVNKKGLHLIQFDSTALDTLDYYKINSDFALFQYNTQFGGSGYQPKTRITSSNKFDFYDYFHLEGGVAWYRFNFNSINENLALLNLGQLPKASFGYTGSFTYYEPLYAYFSANFTYFEEQTFSNDDGSINFNAWQTKVNYGFPCIDNKHLQLAFFTGAGFGKFKIEESYSNTPIFSSPTSVIQANEDLSKVKSTNPALLVDFGTDFRMKFFPFALWAKGGYQLDCSSKKWRSEINSTVKTSHSSLYLKAGASIYFGMN